MNNFMKGAAKRLIFSLGVVSALGGCAVYGPVGPAPYPYATGAYGEAVYPVAPVYASPYAYSPYYYDPLFIGPPVFFNLGVSARGGHRFHDGGFRGSRSGFRRGR